MNLRTAAKKVKPHTYTEPQALAYYREHLKAPPGWHYLGPKGTQPGSMTHWKLVPADSMAEHNPSPELVAAFLKYRHGHGDESMRAYHDALDEHAAPEIYSPEEREQLGHYHRSRANSLYEGTPGDQPIHEARVHDHLAEHYENYGKRKSPFLPAEDPKTKSGKPITLPREALAHAQQIVAGHQLAMNNVPDKDTKEAVANRARAEQMVEAGHAGLEAAAKAHAAEQTSYTAQDHQDAYQHHRAEMEKHKTDSAPYYAHSQLFSAHLRQSDAKGEQERLAERERANAELSAKLAEITRQQQEARAKAAGANPTAKTGDKITWTPKPGDFNDPVTGPVMDVIQDQSGNAGYHVHHL
jgi:hypothetical protein